MQSKLMNKYFKNSHNKPEPLTEGWGTALLQIGVAAGIFGTIVAPTVASTLICAGATLAIAAVNGKTTSVSDSTVDKILNQSKIKQYIIKECDKAWKEAQAKYKNSDKWNLYKKPTEAAYDGWGEEETRMSGSHKLSGLTNYYSYHTVGGYDLMLYSDTDHIDGIKVIFMLKSKTKDKYDTEYKLAMFVLPSPTRDDIKSMGYRKE